jgi:hypothetical protein
MSEYTELVDRRRRLLTRLINSRDSFTVEELEKDYAGQNGGSLQVQIFRNVRRCLKDLRENNGLRYISGRYYTRGL